MFRSTKLLQFCPFRKCTFKKHDPSPSTPLSGARKITGYIYRGVDVRLAYD